MTPQQINDCIDNAVPVWSGGPREGVCGAAHRIFPGMSIQEHAAAADVDHRLYGRLRMFRHGGIVVIWRRDEGQHSLLVANPPRA